LREKYEVKISMGEILSAINAIWLFICTITKTIPANVRLKAIKEGIP
jgi:hypothetical protein